MTRLTLSTTLQATVALIALGATGGGTGYTVWSHHHERSAERAMVRQLAAMQAALSDAQRAQAAAQQQAAQLAQDRAAAPPEPDPADAAKLAELQSNLDAATKQAAQLKAEREKLAAERGKLQSKVGELEQEKEKAARSLAEEREKLRQKMVQLEGKLQKTSRVEDAEEEPSGVVTPAEAGKTGGFSLDKFMASLGIGAQRQESVGGPYVAVGAGKPSAALSPEAQAMLRTLPLSAPLDEYQLESRFGVRTDPFNGHQAMHTGLDLSASYKAPVFSTQAGTVVFAGYAAAYGKMVEIDHGNGIHTRYAHLNRLMVNVGQHVAKHTEVGLLGSTGRSTGPHVHYEVTVNGVPQDPLKFLEAGRAVTLVKASN